MLNDTLIPHMKGSSSPITDSTDPVISDTLQSRATIGQCSEPCSCNRSDETYLGWIKKLIKSFPDLVR
uniref:Uncharacterized protein n=1 Tax=Arundo donax TaxID=35708 RepID=A0A0A8ZJJ4_ARUDO